VLLQVLQLLMKRCNSQGWLVQVLAGAVWGSACAVVLHAMLHAALQPVVRN
jgi:hypothetical protein